MTKRVFSYWRARIRSWNGTVALRLASSGETKFQIERKARRSLRN